GEAQHEHTLAGTSRSRSHLLREIGEESMVHPPEDVDLDAPSLNVEGLVVPDGNLRRAFFAAEPKNKQVAFVGGPSAPGKDQST
ncbi:unnamed protein product, partial [Amoebophrya sp. A25]